MVILTKKGSGEKLLKSRKGARPNSARLVFDICVTLMSGTINQYKINRLYCLLLICIKTSILFCLLKYLEAEHALERNTPAHNTSVVLNTPSEIGNTQSVAELQHAKCSTLKSCNTPNMLIYNTPIVFIYNTHFCPLYHRKDTQPEVRLRHFFVPLFHGRYFSSKQFWFYEFLFADT